MEGVLAWVDEVHPRALRRRLTSFLRTSSAWASVAGPAVRLKPRESLRINARNREQDV
jgi:hypothetical protein